MSKKPVGKIQFLLERAAAQQNSRDSAQSSIESARRVCQSAAEAENLFQKLKSKLLRVELWNENSSVSGFALFDKNGSEQPEKIAKIGDFIKVSLPGSGKDDWIKIIEIHDAENEFVLTVRPSNNPTDKNEKAVTSHFFVADSSNNFCLQKIDERINFYVVGLNEKSNTEETGGVLETIRNFATANVGSFLGVQKFQWQSFCENFLKNE